MASTTRFIGRVYPNGESKKSYRGSPIVFHDLSGMDSIDGKTRKFQNVNQSIHKSVGMALTKYMNKNIMIINTPKTYELL